MLSQCFGILCLNTTIKYITCIAHQYHRFRFQFYPNRNLSCASSLTSCDEEDAFEIMADDLIPEKIFRSDPVNSDQVK